MVNTSRFREKTGTSTGQTSPGVDDGSSLRLTGRGAVGPRGGGAGDLYVRLRVARDERFSRLRIALEELRPDPDQGVRSRLRIRNETS